MKNTAGGGVGWGGWGGGGRWGGPHSWSGLRLGGVVFQRLHQNHHHIYGVARGLVGGPAARWAGVPKSCTRTPTLAGWCSRCCAGARWDGVPKVGVVFQKVVPESPLCILIGLTNVQILHRVLAILSGVGLILSALGLINVQIFYFLVLWDQ